MAAGEQRLGWKIALNVPAVQKQLGISRPVTGYLTASGAVPPGGSHSMAGGTRIGVEPEIAIHIDQDVPPGVEPEAARAAIGALGPAIEIVDINQPFDDLTSILAANVFQRGVVLGSAERSPAEQFPDQVAVRVTRNGREAARADPNETFGELVSTVCLVAELLGCFGERLLTGDVIISGSLTEIVWVEPGDETRVTIEPLGTLEASFTA